MFAVLTSQENWRGLYTILTLKKCNVLSVGFLEHSLSLAPEELSQYFSLYQTALQTSRWGCASATTLRW